MEMTQLTRRFASAELEETEAAHTTRTLTSSHSGISATATAASNVQSHAQTLAPACKDAHPHAHLLTTRTVGVGRENGCPSHTVESTFSRVNVNVALLRPALLRPASVSRPRPVFCPGLRNTQRVLSGGSSKCVDPHHSAIIPTHAHPGCLEDLSFSSFF